MDDPDFWIIKNRQADKPMLTPGQIRRLNQSNIERGLLNDVLVPQPWKHGRREVEKLEEENNSGNHNADPQGPSYFYLEGETLANYLQQETGRIKRAVRWDAAGNSVTADFYTALDENLNLSALREANPIYFGLTRCRTDLRFYPTKEVLTSRRDDLVFDILQVSSVQAFQPLAIMHASRDGQWFFAVSPICRGWVRAQDIVWACRPEEIRKYLNPKRKLVITGHAVEAVWQPGTTATAARLYLGTVCPLLAVESLYYSIGLPDRCENGTLQIQPAYIPRSAKVSEQFLPCTPRVLYGQVFQLLRTPYSWGGKGEFRDCSQLLMDVFATMGVHLPRNSTNQALVGSKRIRLTDRHSLAQRQKILHNLKTPALLQFPGHIMLYLGEDQGRFYAIHDVWSYQSRPADNARCQKVIIGQVAVSDLSLGTGGKQGSFLERLTSINLLQP